MAGALLQLKAHVRLDKPCVEQSARLPDRVTHSLCSSAQLQAKAHYTCVVNRIHCCQIASFNARAWLLS